MITDADVKKLKKTFATKIELQLLGGKLGKLNKRIDLLDKKLDSTTIELLRFIGEVKDEIIKEFHYFRSEFNDFRVEMRDINSTHQSSLDNHEVRIAHLEYNKM